ncbi:MAG: tetratricopeptide repeat protein, partial [Actinomycetota bacterium]|nr:tetratricopeptide repeat protein [Actinomycetota bacterium]
VRTLQQHVSLPCLVAMVGPLGVGKSAICEKLLNTAESRRDFLSDEGGEPVHRRFWVDLEECGPGAAVEERVAKSLSCNTFDAALQRLTNGRRALVVLDNADHAWAGRPAHDPVLAQLAACVDAGARIIVSMRSTERLSPRLSWTATLEVGRFSQAAGAELFRSLAPDRADNPDWIGLLDRCRGLPLAVSLFGRAAAAGRLADVAAVAELGPDDDPEPGADLGLHFALAAAAAALDSEQLRVWAAMSLFPAGMGGDDVAAVLEPMGLTTRRVVRLHHLGIALRSPAGLRVPGPRRIDPAQGGLDKASVAELWQRYTDRAAQVISQEHAGDWLVAHETNLADLGRRPRLPDGVLDVACRGLLVERPGYALASTDATLAILAEAAVGDGPVPARVIEAEDAFRNRYRFSSSERLLEIMLRSSRRAGDRAEQAKTLELLAEVACNQGRYDEGESMLIEAQNIYDDLGDLVGQARTRLARSRVTSIQDNYDQAETMLTEAQKIYDQIGDQLGHADSLHEHGTLAYMQGAYALAESLFVEAQQIYDELGNRLGQANSRHERGKVAGSLGRFVESETMLIEARDIYDDIGDRLGQAASRLALGELIHSRGRHEEAETILAETQKIYDELGDRLGQADCRLERGGVAYGRGRFDDAERHLKLAHQVYRSIGDQLGQANSRLALGRVEMARGRFDQAEAILTEAKETYDEIRDLLGQANSRLEMGKAFTLRELYEQAEPILIEAQELYGEIGDRLGQANTRYHRAMLHEMASWANPRQLFLDAGAIYAEIGIPGWAGRAFAGAARCEHGPNRANAAGRAMKLLQQAGEYEAARLLGLEFGVVVIGEAVASSLGARPPARARTKPTGP